MIMNKLIFNINDLALLLMIAQCSMLAFILMLSRGKSGEGKGTLAALLMIFALQSLDVLIYWSVPVKTIIAEHGAWPFWLFKWAPLAQGPLLFAYVRLKLTGQALSLSDAKHALPILSYPLIVWGIAMQLGPQGMIDGVFKFGVLFQSTIFDTLLWTQKISAAAYGSAAVWFMLKNYKRLEYNFSNPVSAQPLWLPIIVVGFMVLAIFHLAQGVIAFFGWIVINHFSGILSNYLNFAFVTALISYSLLKSAVVTPIPDVLVEADNKAENADVKEDFSPSEEDIQTAHNLTQLLADQQLYLNPELTLEDFSRAARLPERQVSYLLNSVLGQSFFECVNAARVARAKELLAAESWPVQRIFEESGFNSKATFNRIFKRYTHMTPSHYRKHNDMALDTA